ncbi:piggyBac transposable element-derived protein 4-like [Ischnura elegans]|uniref:piggyBac transposable element-derived protein 4-like n=1 Tax=Ischnura elegans TaxID=197161 RepID=UPI001ED8B752|nr:piggyBac transposable element-derived protein 4-like [Ischnura elegans]XP_046394763.1 piggyBac transposable element-derived protein 4-like [Ischnura elegans]
MAAYRVKFAPGYSENEALTDLFGSDEEDIPNESDGSEAEEDNMEVEIEDQEEDEEIQDEYVKDDSRFMVSKDEKIKWDTVEPKTPGKILSRNIIRQDAGFPGHIQCVEKSEFFRCFITDLMVKNICQYTNQRANQIKDRKSLRKWKNLDSIEFLAFLGLCITYGVQKGRGKPLNEFWSDEFGFPIFKATMSRSRFENILSCLRFDNKETREARKRETKNKAEAVSEMMNLFSSACKSSFIPGPNITVDEHLCTFRGRCAFKVYIPSKPGKYGIKIWMAVDCENMYIVNLQIYAGKHGDMREIQQGKRVVMDLVSHLSGSGGNITTDNFFTSFDLGQDLLKLSLTLVGTMRKNRRELPPIMLPSKNREINSSNSAFSHNTLLTSYVPSKGKSVVLLSTQHKAFEICSSEKKKPEVILYYNSTKFGVDTVDQMARQYSVKRGTRRWPLTIFFDIVDLAGINAYQMYLRKYPSFRGKNSRRRFLLELAKELITPEIHRRIGKTGCQTKRIQTAIKNAGIGNILPENEIEIMSKNKRGRCCICPRKSDKKTNTHCNICNRYVCSNHVQKRSICMQCDSNGSGDEDSD